MENGGRTIPEKTFVEIENQRKTALSLLIRRSGLAYSFIAKQTGVERRAVTRAAACEGIRYDTATRLEFYLENYFLTIKPKAK